MWTPKKDKLPEKFGSYLCVLERYYSYKIGWKEFTTREVYQSIECFDGKRFEMTQHIHSDLEVIFWMELPEMPEWYKLDTTVAGDWLPF